jgi:ABC-type branched-subunit amino acid transport system ATPase component
VVEVDVPPPRRPAAVSCSDLSVWFGPCRALAHTDIEIPRGDLIAILGTNGAGKSTLLRALCGLVVPTSGRVYLDGRDVTELTAEEHAAMGMTLASVQESLFADMTVRDSLSLAAHARGGRGQIEAAIAEMLDVLPSLRHRLDARVHTLSGGEQRMLALAQAQIRGPRVLLIDELSLGLSVKSSDAAWHLVSALHATGTTVLIVEQSLESVLSRARRAIFLDDGEILYDGSPEKLRERTDLVSARLLAATGTVPDS